jgi:hypothetical protein
MALRGPWAVEIKKGMVATACSKAHVFLRHARALLRFLQDVWASDVIVACTLADRHYSTALQCRAT